MNMGLKSCFGVRLVPLLLATGWSLAGSPACFWSSETEFSGVSLACSGPRLTSVPRKLPQSLEMLRLNGTGLRILDSDTFRHQQLTSLSYLYVSHGVLAVVTTGALCSLTALTDVDLSNNKLQEIDASSFECNRNLRRVNLSGNPSLGHLPALVSDTIRTVNANRCGITDVDIGDLQGLPALKILLLDGNLNLDCLAVKNKLSRPYPKLVVVCDDEISSTSPTVSGATSIYKTQPHSGTTTTTSKVPKRQDAETVGQSSHDFMKISKHHKKSTSGSSTTLPSHVTVSKKRTDTTGQSSNDFKKIIEGNGETHFGTSTTLTPHVAVSTTEVPASQRTEITGPSPHDFKKNSQDNSFVITHPDELNDMESIYLIIIGVTLLLILLLSFLICYLKTKPTIADIVN